MKKDKTVCDHHGYQEICPCCLGTTTITEKVYGYEQHFCRDCEHIWFSDQKSITKTDYEESDKYNDYYIGRPPFLWYHRKAKDYIIRNCKQSSILDFGCYDGFFTKSLIDAGLKADGCDWNQRALAQGRAEFGLGARLSSEPTGIYDVIVALEVIEHFEDPNFFIDTILPHVSPGGTLILSCPNSDAIYRPKTDAPPHHYSRFSEKSLQTILQRRGFEPVLHLHEMSSFQLLRNIIGDAFRHEAPLLDKPQGTARAAFERPLKRAANFLAGGLSIALMPIDSLMRKAGLIYISQFVVARLRNDP